MAQRQNVEFIANALISKINAMNEVAKRIEIASEKELKIDTAEMKFLIEKQRSAEDSILRDLRDIQKKNSTRVPNWILAILAVTYLCSFGFAMYAWKKAETYDAQKERAIYFEREFNKLNQ